MIYIEGFDKRVEEACFHSGLSKSEIARRCGFDRKVLQTSRREMMNGGNLAKFCYVTGTDANWLLGLTRYRRWRPSCRLVK